MFRRTHMLDYAAPSVRRLREPWTTGEILLYAGTALIIAILVAAFAIPRFAGRSESVGWDHPRVDLHLLSSALDAFHSDTGRYPTQREGFGALVAAPPGLANWSGPFLDRVPLDPWNHPYFYHPSSTGASDGFTIRCAGPDGKEGTPDDQSIESP